MNVLRKKRKKNIKVRIKTIILLIFSLIMTTFAWITYSKILNSEIQIDINSWDLSFYVDKNNNDIADEDEEQEKPIDVNLTDLYPGMEEKIVKVFIRNNGETPTDILYTSSEINILGNEYTVEEVAPIDTEYYILKHEPVIGNGITSVDFINEPERFPFKISIEHTQEILSGGEGYLIIKVTWPLYTGTDEEIENEKDLLDTDWGYKVAKYLEDNKDNPDITGAFHAKVRINAIGKPREGYGINELESTLVTQVTPANYGEYVNYPVDVNSDGDTTNDWRIFYDDGYNVFLISSEYAPTTMFPETEKFNTYYPTYKYVIKPAIENRTNNLTEKSIFKKYMLSKLDEFDPSYSNYKVSNLWYDTNLTQNFVVNTYADSAIMTPSLEMFVESWNQVYPNEKLYCDSWNEEGYYAGIQTKPTTHLLEFEFMKNLSGYNNTLYYPYKTNFDECEGYWLSSPSAGDDEAVYEGKVNHILDVSVEDTYNLYAVRPVVCIKSNVNAQKDENGVWQFVESFKDKVTIENYGDYTNYPVNIDDNPTDNDWRIFYNDGNNVFLIADDYIPNTKIPDSTITASGMIRTGTYNVHWGDPSSLSDTIDFASRFINLGMSKIESTNSNYQMASTLLNTEKWDSLVREEFALEAIGTPTLEMWIASWNSVYQRNKLHFNNLNADNTISEKGLYIGTITDPTDLEITDEKMQIFSGYNNSLYYKHRDVVDNCKGYWLAAPSAVEFADSMFTVNASGGITSVNNENTDYGLRPVVCIKSNIESEQDENGVWKFEQ